MAQRERLTDADFDTPSVESTVPRKTGYFQKGGDPRRGTGKTGSRHRVALICDKLANGRATALITKALALAENGDTEMLRLVLSRVWPASKGRPVRISLPEVSTSHDIVAAYTALTEQVANGYLTPEEADSVGGILENQRKAIEMIALEGRLEALEAALLGKTP